MARRLRQRLGRCQLMAGFAVSINGWIWVSTEARINLVIPSHNHADHIGGLIEVVRQFPPTFFMDNGVPATTETYARLLGAVKGAGSGLREPISRTISLADGLLRVIPPPRTTDWDQNDNSIGIVVKYGAFRLSLMGDAEPRE